MVLAGLTAPPLEAGRRALWPSVLPDPEQRRAALAVDTAIRIAAVLPGAWQSRTEICALRSASQ